MLSYQRILKKIKEKKGFLIISFLTYLSLYTFLCGIIFYFSLFFIRLMNDLQDKSRAFYAYQTIQKKFIEDCAACIDVDIKKNKLNILFLNGKVVWKLKGTSLIRKEYKDTKNDSKKMTIYFCTVAKNFVPVVHEKNAYLHIEFMISLFSNSFTMSAVTEKGEGR